MYFFWCTKYLINAPLGELKKKQKKKKNCAKDGKGVEGVKN